MVCTGLCVPWEGRGAGGGSVAGRVALPSGGHPEGSFSRTFHDVKGPGCPESPSRRSSCPHRGPGSSGRGGGPQW